MRAVIAVLRAAGNLKRSDGHLTEEVLVRSNARMWSNHVCMYGCMHYLTTDSGPAINYRCELAEVFIP